VCFFCSNFPGKQTGERGRGLYIGVGVSGLCFFFFFFPGEEAEEDLIGGRRWWWW